MVYSMYPVLGRHPGLNNPQYDLMFLFTKKFWHPDVCLHFAAHDSGVNLFSEVAVPMSSPPKFLQAPTKTLVRQPDMREN